MSAKEPEKPITSIDEVLWVDEQGNVVPLPYEVLHRPAAQAIPEEVETSIKTILWQRPPGPKVSEWLPQHIKKLDTIAKVYDLAKPGFKIPNWFFDRYKDILEPTVKVEAQLLILFRLGLHQTEGTIGSEIAEVVQTKVERRNVVVAALVLGDTVFIHVSPAVGKSLDIEEMSNVLFKQLFEKGDEVMVIRASRSEKRISEPIE